MNDDIITSLHTKQIEIMDSIHKVCLDNNINYYLIAGSCLGAIRHKGFIPWDVDIDIAMPREDYDRFFSDACKQLPSKFVAHTYKTDEVFSKPHGLVCLKDSVLLTKADIDNSQMPEFGIFIDVFPLDKCPDDKNLQRKHKRDYLFFRKVRFFKMSRTYRENGFIVKLIKYFIRFLFLPLSYKRINGWQEKVMTRYKDLNPCHLWCSMASKYPYEKQLMDKSIYGKPTLGQFEDRYYFLPEKPKDYLAKLYKDYMKLPSEEEQEMMKNYFVEASWKD